MTIAALILRYLLAVVFVRSGLLKVLDMGEFRLAVGNYRLLPEMLVGPATWAVPTLEFGCGILLVAGVATGPVAAVLVGLLAVFSVAVAVNLLRGRAISCGCSGRVAAQITWRHVATNVGLAGAGAFVSVWAVQPLTVAAIWGVRNQLLMGAGGAIGVLVAVGSAGAAGLLAAEAVRVRGLSDRGEKGRRQQS